MPSDKEVEEALRVYSRQQALQEDISDNFTNGFAGMIRYPRDDKSAALLSHSTLDQHLSRALATHFSPPTIEDNKELFRTGLSTFSAKWRLASALGVFGEEMNRDLKWVNLIRNAFAHASVKLNFSDQLVADACDKLLLPRSLRRPPGFVDPWPLVLPRDKYVGTVASITEWLNTESTRGRPLTMRDREFARTYQFNYAWPVP